jgi:hypothetical protein
MADELRVVITADASGVGPGVAEATAAVKSSADQIATAQAKATAATRLLTQAQIELGAAAEAGNTQAAAIIAEYAAANSAAQASVEALTAAQVESTAATVADTAAQAADTAATYSHAEAMGAAKISMGAMTGSTHMMEMGLVKLASGSSVLGPLLASMVPVAIFAAGTFLLYELGAAIYKAFDLGGEAAREFELKLSGLDASYRSLIDETSLEADKIEAANAKLEHMPNPNAMKEAIDQAMVEADKMNGKLQGLIDKEESLLKMQTLAGSTLQRLSTTTGTRQEQIDLEQHALWTEKAVSLEAQLAEAKSFTAVEEKKLHDLRVQQMMTVEQPEALNNEITATELLVADTKKETAAIEEQMRLRDAQAKHEELTGQGKGATSRTTADNMPEQIARAQIEATHAADAQLAPEQEIIAAMDKQIALNNLKAETTKEGTEAEREQLRVIENGLALAQAKEKIAALGKEQLAATFEAEQKEQTEAQKRQEDQAKKALEDYNRVREMRVSAAHETAQATIESANLEFERTEQQIHGEEELGIISHKVAMERLLDALKLREATTQGALKKEQGLFDPALGEKEALEYEKLERQMAQEAQRAALERERIVQQEATKIEQIYKRVANTFNTDFTRAFNEWATKSQTASQAFSRMLGDMELQVVDFVAKWLLQKAEMWAMNEILDAGGLASSVAKNTIANTQKIISDAAVGAAGAEAAAAPAGPEAMAAAGAVATVMIMSNLSTVTMDTGGMLPHMAMAFNTSGSAERILSPSQTSNFESLVNNGGSRRATLNQTNHFGGGVTRQMLDEHTNKTMRALRGMLRPEAFA